MSLDDMTLMVKKQYGKSAMDRQHEFPSIRAGMPMRPNVGPRLHGIKQALDAGIERFMNIQVLAESGKAASGFTHALEFVMGDDPAFHAFRMIEVFELEGRRPVITFGSSSLFDPSRGGSFFEPLCFSVERRHPVAGGPRWGPLVLWV